MRPGPPKVWCRGLVGRRLVCDRRYGPVHHPWFVYPIGANLYDACGMPPRQLVWKSIGDVCGPAKCHSPFAFISQYRPPPDAPILRHEI
jgi:hypothetical protein